MTQIFGHFADDTGQFFPGAPYLVSLALLLVAIDVLWRTMRGPRPHAGAPTALETFSSSLVLLDPVAAALLLFAKRRAGLALAAIIMVCDVVGNSYAFLTLCAVP